MCALILLFDSEYVSLCIFECNDSTDCYVSVTNCSRYLDQDLRIVYQFSVLATLSDTTKAFYLIDFRDFNSVSTPLPFTIASKINNVVSGNTTCNKTLNE